MGTNCPHPLENALLLLSYCFFHICLDNIYNLSKRQAAFKIQKKL